MLVANDVEVEGGAQRRHLHRQSGAKPEIRQTQTHKRVVVLRWDIEASHGGIAHAEGVDVVAALGLESRLRQGHTSVVVVVCWAVAGGVWSEEG